jgi:hypothetical protein
VLKIEGNTLAAGSAALMIDYTGKYREGQGHFSLF